MERRFSTGGPLTGKGAEGASLEVAFLLVIAVSATLGWLLRRTVSAKVAAAAVANWLENVY